MLMASDSAPRHEHPTEKRGGRPPRGASASKVRSEIRPPPLTVKHSDRKVHLPVSPSSRKARPSDTAPKVDVPITTQPKEYTPLASSPKLTPKGSKSASSFKARLSDAAPKVDVPITTNLPASSPKLTPKGSKSTSSFKAYPSDTPPKVDVPITTRLPKELKLPASPPKQSPKGSNAFDGAKPRRKAKKSHRLPAGSHIIDGEGVYVGSLNSEGKREGANCKHMFPNGDVYKGEWQSDERHGTGRMKYRTGAIFEGCWVHDVRHGYGRLTYPNGDEYNGAWEDDTKQGIGRFIWAEQGAEYEGQFHGGMIHGHGKYKFADGCVYEGQYEHGERRGRGVLVTADGVRQPGTWRGLVRQPSRKELEEAYLNGTSSAFRPDLVIQRDPAKHMVEKMLMIEEKLEGLKLEARMEEASGLNPTGEEWDPLTPRII